MPIYHDGKKMKPYRGYRKPVNVYYGDKKVAGWKNSTQTGNKLTFQTTYNDTADVVVKGKTLQKSEWVHKQGLITQANYTGKNLFNSIWSGNYYVSSDGSLALNTQFGLSDYIPVYPGQIVSFYVIDADEINLVHYNESKTYVNQMGTGLTYKVENYTIPDDIYYVRLRPKKNSGFLLSSLGQLENGPFITPYEPYTGGIPAPNPGFPQPLISNLPAGTYKTKDWKGDWWEFTLASDLCGIGTVLDSVEFDKYGHGGYLRRGNKKYLLQSADILAIDINANSNRVRITKPADGIGATSASVNNWTLMTIARERVTYSSDDASNIGYFTGVQVGNQYCVFVSKDTITDLATARTLFTGVELAYQLATPTRTPITFTLNNSSTVPECPMEFLTDTPSGEYPAEVFDASGEVKVENADGSKLVTAPIEILRSNADGTVYDEFEVKTGKVTKRMSDWANITGANTLTKADSTLLTYKALKMSLGDLPIPAMATTNITAQKYDSTLLTAVNASPTSADRIYTDGSYFYLSAPMADTGFSEACLPSDGEIKAYFYGYKMCHASGLSPYYKSEVPYNPTTWEGWNKGGTSYVNAANQSVVITGNNPITFYVATLTAGVKYGFIYEVVSKTGTANMATSTAFNWSTLGSTVGNEKIVITATTSGYCVFYRPAAVAEDTIELKGIRIFTIPTGSQIETDFTTLTADQLAIKYPFDGLNVKHWKHLVGTEAEIQASITSTLPTASYEGFTPYKMIYELAEPIEEQYTPVTLPTYYPTTVITTTNDTPAELETTTSVKVEDEE